MSDRKPMPKVIVDPEAVEQREEEARRKKDRKETGRAVAAGLLDAGREANAVGMDAARAAISQTVRQDERPGRYDIPSFRHGGKMRHAGVARLHRGERVKKSRGGKR